MKYLKESSLMATKDCGTPSTTVLIEATSCLYSSTRAWLGLFWDIWLLFGDIWLGWFWNIWVAEISFCVQVFKRAGKETLTLFFGRFLLNHSSMACTWISQANVYCGKSTNFHIIHKIFMSRNFFVSFFGENWGLGGGYPLGSYLSDWVICTLLLPEATSSTGETQSHTSASFPSSWGQNHRHNYHTANGAANAQDIRCIACDLKSLFW